MHARAPGAKGERAARVDDHRQQRHEPWIAGGDPVGDERQHVRFVLDRPTEADALPGERREVLRQLRAERRAEFGVALRRERQASFDELSAQGGAGCRPLRRARRTSRNACGGP